MCLSIYLTDLSVGLSVYPSIDLSFYQSIYRLIHLPTYLPIYLSIRPSIYLIYLIYLSIYLSILSIYLSIHPSYLSYLSFLSYPSYPNPVLSFPILTHPILSHLSIPSFFPINFTSVYLIWILVCWFIYVCTFCAEINQPTRTMYITYAICHIICQYMSLINEHYWSHKWNGWGVGFLWWCLDSRIWWGQPGTRTIILHYVPFGNSTICYGKSYKCRFACNILNVKGFKGFTTMWIQILGDVHYSFRASLLPQFQVQRNPGESIMARLHCCHVYQGSPGKLDRFAIWKTDWWFGTWILWLSIQLGMSSSQLLLKLHHFSEGLKYHEPENHKRKLSIRGPVSIAVIPMWNYQRVDAKNVPSSVDILRFWHSVFNSWVSAQWWFPVRPLYV